MIVALLGRYPTVSEVFVYRELAGLMAAGARVGVYSLELTRHPQDVLLPAPPKAVPTASWVLRAERPSATLREAWAQAGGRPKDLRRAGWLARELRSVGARALHVHFVADAAAIGAAAALMAGVPLCVTVHARGIHVPSALGLWALKQAQQVISISRDAVEACRARAGVESALLPLAIEPAPPAPVGPLGLLTLLTVARPVPKKGYPTLRAALEGLDAPWRWRVAGASADELGGPHPRLDAKGMIPASVIQKMYQEGVDAFALACQSAPDGDRDGVPVALMEAMARGVPVLSCPVGGVEELIEDGRTGLLVPPQDPAAMRAALQRLAEDPELRRRLGAAGREHVRQHRSPEVRAQALLELLGGLYGG